MRLRHILLLSGACAAVSAAQQAPLTPSEQATLIEEVRPKTLEYSKLLPDFLCTETTRRYSTAASVSPNPTWKLLDTLTIQVSYFSQKENYRVVKVDDKPADKQLQKMGGSKVMGDFGSMLRDVFRPDSQAKFEWSKWSVRNDRPVAVFSFRIEQAHSRFGSGHTVNILGLVRNSVNVKWAAKGLVYIDPETRQVYRLTIDSVDMPSTFPMKDVHIAIDYANRQVNGREYLLPVRSVSSVSSHTSNGKVYKSESEFGDYRKFSADASVSFAPETDESPTKKQ